MKVNLLPIEDVSQQPEQRVGEMYMRLMTKSGWQLSEDEGNFVVRTASEQAAQLLQVHFSTCIPTLCG